MSAIGKVLAARMAFRRRMPMPLKIGPSKSELQQQLKEAVSNTVKMGRQGKARA